MIASKRFRGSFLQETPRGIDNSREKGDDQTPTGTGKVFGSAAGGTR